MKLSLEDKKEIIRLHFEEGFGSTRLSHKFNIQKSSIEKIILGYKSHGDDYLIHPPKNNIYSPKVKEGIIKRVYDGESKTSLAAEYGIPGGSGTIVSWIHKYEEFGYNGLINKKRGRQKVDKQDEVKLDDEPTTETKIDLSSPLTDAERLEFEELKKKYKILQRDKQLSDMENVFLKKLDALVQERLKRERKK